MCRLIKDFSLLSMFFLSIVPAVGQTASVSQAKAELDSLFSGLDKTRVPTGFLWDVSVNLVDGEAYNGSSMTDSNYVSMGIMKDMLQSLNSASVGADTICVQAALSRIQRNSSPDHQMVGVLFQPYNYIVNNALNDNLISYSGGVVSDSYVNGVWQDPYGEDVLYGYSLGNGGIVDSYVTYTLANVDSLSSQVFQSIQFDPGDGNGFRNVSIGGSVAVYYYLPGQIETKLKVTVGGQTYYSHGWVFVRFPNVAPDSLAPNLPEPTALFQGQQYKAKICFEDSVQFLKQPLIVSEGFDPWQLSGGSGYSGFNTINGIINATDPITGDSLFSGYDVFYVDWYDCGADIRANAEVFKVVIQWVNSQYYYAKPIVVMGQSMGGLIARYALRDMELHGDPHNTTLFISHDVPYLGANVSIGLQYLYWDLLETVNNLRAGNLIRNVVGTEVYNELTDIGNHTSVKQMLPIYIGSDHVLSSTEYNAFRDTLQSIGFPQGDPGRPIENVAIVNGGKQASGNASIYSPGDKLVNVNITGCSSILEGIAVFNNGRNWPVLVPGKGSYSWNYEVSPYLSNDAIVHKAELKIKKKLLWLVDRTYTLHSVEHRSPATGVPYDAVSGSYYTYSGNHFGISIPSLNTLMFIPTASAMESSNFYRDYYNSKPIPKEETPFSSYILQDTASTHIDFFVGVKDWLEAVVNTKMTAPIIFWGSASAQLSGVPSGRTFNWSSSNPSVATVDPSSGLVTQIGNGTVTLTATSVSDGQYITKSADVLVGYPAMTLRSWMMQGNKCLVKANTGSGIEGKLVKAAVDSCLLSYRWGVKYGNQAISWTTSQADTVQVNLPSSGTVIVYFQWQRPGGQTGGETSIELLRGGSFQSNLLDMQVRNGTVISYSENLFSDPAITSDYGHTCFTVSTYMNGQDTTNVVSVSMGDLTFPVTEIRYAPDGKPVYVFDILYDSDFLSELYDKYVQNLNSSVIVPFYLNDSAGPFQKLDIFCRRVSHEGPIFEDPE